MPHTRSANHSDHRLQTPDTFVRGPLPGLRNGMAIVHASPAGGASFVQYTVEFERDGALAPCGDQRFVYVVEGRIAAGTASLDRGDFAYVPAGQTTAICANGVARAIVIEKRLEPLASGASPTAFTGREPLVAGTTLEDDPWLEVRSLVPDEPVFDFRVNTMTFRPGAALPRVEIHVMEHGLTMLEGGGIYRLGDRWYEVEAGDFIWMAPYCPQWFAAVGKQPAKYLIYKDWGRAPR